MQKRNLTIMFTDMKGFTVRTSAQSRDATIDMIKQHRDLLLPVIAKFGGRLIKGIGDAFLLTFESPTDAVLSGIALQKTLSIHNQALPEKERVEIRVAINTGEVLLEDNDVYGEAVNIAARIEGIAEPNEVYFTESTFLSMNKSEVPSAEVGLRILKGIPDKIKVYKVLKDGETIAAVSHVVGDTDDAKPAIERDAPAPRFRRILAFTIDVIVILLAVLILHGKDLSVQKQTRLALEKEAQKTAQMIMRKDQQSMKDFVAGHGDLPVTFPSRDKLIDLRQEIQQLIDSHDVAQMKTDEILKLVGSDPGLRAKVESLRNSLRKDLERRAHKLITGSQSKETMDGYGKHYKTYIDKRDAFQKRSDDMGGSVVTTWLMLFLLYSAVCTGGFGRTLGKKFTRLHVERLNGGRLGWVRGFLRTLLYLVSAIPLGLGFFWALFGARQGWHDKIAESHVIYRISNSN